MSIDVGAAHRYTDQAGVVDVSFNAVGVHADQGTALANLALGDFAFSIDTWPSTQFLTARAAAKQMIKKRQGVVLVLTGSPARFAIPMAGGFGVACAAIEELTRVLAAQLRPQGVRVVRLRAHPIDDSGFSADLPMEEAAFRKLLSDMTLLERVPILAEVADTAVFLASDHAGAITGAVANLTAV
jgi:3-oxoacyl-[acyl-carrier protein] reductase